MTLNCILIQITILYTNNLYPVIWGGNHHDEVANMLNCNMEVIEFDLQSRYCVHFQTNTLGKVIIPSPFIHQQAAGETVLLLFYKNDFGIK